MLFIFIFAALAAGSLASLLGYAMLTMTDLYTLDHTIHVFVFSGVELMLIAAVFFAVKAAWNERRYW